MIWLGAPLASTPAASRRQIPLHHKWRLVDLQRRGGTSQDLGVQLTRSYCAAASAVFHLSGRQLLAVDATDDVMNRYPFAISVYAQTAMVFALHARQHADSLIGRSHPTLDVDRVAELDAIDLALSHGEFADAVG